MENRPGVETQNVRGEARQGSSSPSDANLPTFTDAACRSIQVESTDGKKTYVVDLQSYTCTCPDFVEKRAKEPPLVATRACKHICRLLNAEPNKSRLSPLVRCMVENCAEHGFGVPPGWLIDNDGQTVFISFPNKGWCDLFVPKRTRALRYERYGYNVYDKRWSYGKAPAGARGLRDYLHRQLLTGKAAPPSGGQDELGCTVGLILIVGLGLLLYMIFR
jgi:hypothetical protein